MTNKIAVVTANRIGSEGGLNFTGLSVVCDARGNVIVTGPESEEAVITVDIDPMESRDKSVNPRNDLFADRRPDIYAPIISTDQTEKPR